MGWLGPVVGNVQHEGWVVPVFADGAEGVGTTSAQGVLVSMDPEEWRPDAAVIGWRPGCDCGWRGQVWTRVAAPDLADPDSRLLAVTGPWADLEDADETLVIDEWRRHIAPWKGLEAIEDAAAGHAAATRSLNEAVRAAKAAGASWADIGRAAGISRQSAHERWSTLGA